MNKPNELRQWIKYEILVPLETELIYKHERERGNLKKKSSHQLYEIALDAILDAVIEALPEIKPDYIPEGTTNPSNLHYNGVRLGHLEHHNEIKAILTSAKGDKQ